MSEIFIVKDIPLEFEPIALELVKRIEAERALRLDEEKLINAIIRREERRLRSQGIKKYHSWTAKEKKDLSKMLADPNCVKIFSKKYKIAEHQVRHMARHLRDGIRNQMEVNS